MSKPNPQGSKDIYAIYQQNANKFFNDFDQSISQYQQSITNYQKECLESCKKVFDAAISFQQEFAEKSGTVSKLPEATQKTINDAIEATDRLYKMQNKVTLATIDTSIQNIKALNDNAKSFVELNRSITQSWQPILSPKQQ